MNRHTRLMGVLLLGLACCSTDVVASGNITTTSGGIYLLPAGNTVTLGSGTELVISNLEGNVSRIYSKDIGGGNNVLFTNVTGGSQGAYIHNLLTHKPYIFQTSKKEFQFKIITGSDGSSSEGGAWFYYLPLNNATNKMALIMGYNDASYAGFGINAYQSHDKVLFPWTNGEYDLGKSGFRWRNGYFQNIYYSGNILAQSRGYPGSGLDALNALSTIETLPDGEINHLKVDPSLGDGGSIRTDSVVYADSKAIVFLWEKIKKLEAENQELKQRVLAYGGNN